MSYNTKEKKLIINLSKESYDAKILLEHKDVTFIRINECVEQFELPVALKDYKSLTELYISGGNRDILYPPPLHLEKLTNIRKLSLWSYCDLKKLKPMPHIEALNIVIKNPFVDVQTISSIFPNLKKMETWGGRLKSGELPPEIGNFKHLEHLEFISCELIDLPSEFKQLKNLKFLRMGGLTQGVFPRILYEMNGLEELDFGGNIVTLPSDFSDLKTLKKLDFSYAFNKGTTSPVDKWSDKPIYLHPIPEVIGKLPSLQELDLSCCGVVDLAFLKSSKNLKKLTIRFSGFANCDDLSNFKTLEVLSLENANILTDIKGLAGLPIKRLNLEGCSDLKSIDPIKELQALEELNIKGCDSIKNFDEIYQHPKLKMLKASPAIMKQWQFKERFKNIPPLDDVIADLSSENVVIVAKAMNNLGLYVNKNHSSNNNYNPLAGFFGVDIEEDELIALPILDEAFIKHKDGLTLGTVVDLVKTSFKSVSYDNYTITILAIQEIIKRKDVEAQKQVIAQFDEACGAYDYGHRYHGYTVHDQLFDDFFRQFESAALIDLLTDAHGDMLNCEGGDRLFIPAFEKCKNNSDFNRLLTAFFEYQDESLEYHGFQYFANLHAEILAILAKIYLPKFTDEIEKRNSQTKLFMLLESNDSNDIIKLIKLLGKEENEGFAKSNDIDILRKINQFDISLNHVMTALNFFIKIKEGSYILQDTLLKYMLPNGKDTVVAYLKAKENNNNQKYIEGIVTKIINKLNKKNASMKDIQPFREYLKELKQCDENEIYNIEIESLFKTIKEARKYDAVVFKQLTRFEKLIGLVRSPLTKLKDNEVGYALRMMTSGYDAKRWELIKRLFNALAAVSDSINITSILYTAVISAGITKDRDFMLSLLQHIPETVEEDMLAYNLACAFSIFSEKKSMLKYIRRSLELGRTKAQFLGDGDFAQYLKDTDFLKVLRV